jgi:hypothetical protein
MRIDPTLLRSRRRTLAVLGASLIGTATLTAAGLNIASAQQTPASTATVSTGLGVVLTQATGDPAELNKRQQEFISTLASKLGVTTDKLQQALKDTQQEVGPVPPFVFGKPAAAVTISDMLGPAARTIGISEDQLRKELAGKSLTDVARAHNLDPQVVANALKAARAQDIDQAVQSGKLTPDMANKIKNDLDHMIQMEMAFVRPTSLPDQPGAALFIGTSAAKP